jgi:hypothetical protein
MSTSKIKRVNARPETGQGSDLKPDAAQSSGGKGTGPQNAKETMKELGARWGVSFKTAAKWRRQGAPIEDDAELASWLVARKEIAPGPRAKIAEMAAALRKAKAEAGEIAREPVWGGGLVNPDREPAKEGVDVAAAVTEGTRGAASALRRQEDEELASYARLKTAIASGDAAEEKDARAAWLKTSESLRKFDLLVEAARRDAGELLPRSEWSRMFRAGIFWFLHSINRAHDELCEKLVGMPDGVAAWRVLDADLINRMGEAFAFACRRESAMSLPKWATDDAMAALLTPLEEQPTPDKIP